VYIHVYNYIASMSVVEVSGHINQDCGMVFVINTINIIVIRRVTCPNKGIA